MAYQVGMLIKGFAPLGIVDDLPGLNRALELYAELLHPWARMVVDRMLSEVSRTNEAAWASLGKEMGRALRKEIKGAATGGAYLDLMNSQVDLIQSIPRAAAQRVHGLVTEALSDSTRAREIAGEILRSSDVSASKAMLIARTEVSRASTTLTQARAEHVGSPGYIWTTSHDGDVRASHKAMDGQFVKWSEPPTLDNLTGHAGCVPNCRCYAAVVLADEDH